LCGHFLGACFGTMMWCKILFQTSTWKYFDDSQYINNAFQKSCSSVYHLTICMYNVKLRCAHITIVAMGIQELLHILRVCLSLSYPACKAHAHVVVCDLTGSRIFFHKHKQHNFCLRGGDLFNMHVLTTSTTHNADFVNHCIRLAGSTIHWKVHTHLPTVQYCGACSPQSFLQSYVTMSCISSRCNLDYDTVAWVILPKHAFREPRRVMEWLTPIQNSYNKPQIHTNRTQQV
jgi:hypothetical protein